MCSNSACTITFNYLYGRQGVLNIDFSAEKLQNYLRKLLLAVFIEVPVSYIIEPNLKGPISTKTWSTLRVFWLSHNKSCAICD